MFDVGGYDALYAGQGKSKMHWRIMRDVYGDDFPEEVEPACFITRSDLVRMTHCLSLGGGEILADVGCGRGGVGLWLARELGADLIGVDLSREAIEQARQRAADFSLEGHARFTVADVCRTTLEDKSCHGAVCVDVMGMVPDQAAAVREVARILCCGARFVLMWWEITRSGEIDYSRLLQENGFVVEDRYEKPDWKELQLAYYHRVLAEHDKLIEEMGVGAAQFLIDDAEFGLGWVEDRRRVFIVGRRV